MLFFPKWLCQFFGVLNRTHHLSRVNQTELFTLGFLVVMNEKSHFYSVIHSGKTSEIYPINSVLEIILSFQGCINNFE